MGVLGGMFFFQAKLSSGYRFGSPGKWFFFCKKKKKKKPNTEDSGSLLVVVTGMM